MDLSIASHTMSLPNTTSAISDMLQLHLVTVKTENAVNALVFPRVACAVASNILVVDVEGGKCTVDPLLHPPGGLSAVLWSHNGSELFSSWSDAHKLCFPPSGEFVAHQQETTKRFIYSMYLGQILSKVRLKWLLRLRGHLTLHCHNESPSSHQMTRKTFPVLRKWQAGVAKQNCHHTALRDGINLLPRRNSVRCPNSDRLLLASKLHRHQISHHMLSKSMIGLLPQELSVMFIDSSPVQVLISRRHR
ncbi:hypothetical protein HD554DRAFT_673659 [Boletus coccyginus]|nr:hypothetical protein HD554DRAFT_673659 [Boletus coccyginus]